MALSPEQWSRVRRAYGRASEADPSSRERIVADECAGNVALVEEVRCMLAAGASDDRLELGAPIRIDALVATAERTMSEDLELDRYRILRRLGEGGMGVVYEAERSDGAFERRVAIKVMTIGDNCEATRLKLSTPYYYSPFGRH